MTVYIKPSTAHGEIIAPPSKSVAHRALICAALSGGSKVDNIAFSEDIKATVGGLETLGADIKTGDGFVTLGGINKTKIKEAKIDANESGSTLRFLIPIALIFGKNITFCGKERLFSRDLSVYEEIAKEQGIKFKKSKSSLTVCGELKSGEYKVRGDVSSQFISGLMFSLPLLSGDSFIRFTTKVESRPYIDITVKVLSDFGITVTPAENGYFIPGSQSYSRCDYTVEGDYSNAAFLDAFNLLGGSVKVNGLSSATAQGDRVYKDFFKRIKDGGEYDITDCPDLAPVLFALAAEFSGARFIGTKRLKIKESDRAQALSEEIKKFGGELSVRENEVVVKKTMLHTPGVPLDSHGDHRIVMALSILASRYGGVIDNAQAVSKSYPEFFGDIKKLGIEVDINDN